MNGTPKKKEILHRVIFFRESCAKLRRLQDRFNLRRHFLELPNVLLDILSGKRAANLSEVDGEDVEHSQLSGEGFGRSDADFLAGIGIKHAVGFSRDGGIDHIRNSDSARALGFRLTLCGCSV